MTNQEYLDKYIDYLSARGHNRSYYNVMRIWLKYLQEQKIEVFTQETITQFFIANNYSKNTKSSFIRAGRDFYTAYMQVPKENNEWYKIKLIKVPRKVQEYFTEKNLDEAKKQLITYFSHKITPVKIRALLDFMFYSGCRKEELLRLKREDFNLEEKTAKLYGKGGKERIICYPAKVKKELEEYFISEAQETNAFNITLDKLHYIIRLINKYSGGMKIHCHSFRHGFAKNCLRKGISLPTVSRLLGHSSIMTTMIYADPSEDEMKETYQEKMNKEK
jgi:site-specific recombinase XerD